MADHSDKVSSETGSPEVSKLQKFYTLRFLIALLLIVLLTELVVSGMSWLYFAEIRHDYLVTGLVASLLVSASLVAPVVMMILKHLESIKTEQRQSRVRLDTLFNSILDPVWVKDPQGVYLACNPAFERMYGATEAQILGKSDYDFVEPELADFFRAHDRQALENDAPTINEEFLKFQADDYCGYFETVKTPLKDEQGRVLGVLGIARDITERKRLAETLQHSEDSLEQAQAIAQIGSWRLDILNNDLQWSKQTYRIFGLPPGTPVNLDTFVDCIYPEDRQSVLDAWAASLAGQPYDIEHRIVVDGEIKWVRERANLEQAADGEMISGIGTVQDITDRKHSELALAATRERLEFALQGASDGLWEWNLETDEAYYSPRWKSMLGYTDDELSNTLETWKLLVHPDDQETTLQQVADYLAGRKKHFKVEFRIRHKQGNWLDVLSSAVLAHDEQGNPLQPRRLIGTHVDISMRKAVELSLLRERMRLEATLENTPNVAVQWYDRQGRVQYWNNASERLYGYSSVEALGKTLDQLIFTEEQAAAYLETIKDICQRDIVVGPMELKTRKRNGDDCIVEVTLFKIPGKGESPMVACMDVDITSRQQAEVALKESELRFRKLFEDSPQATLIVEDNHFIKCNRAALSMLLFDEERQIINISPSTISPEYQPDGQRSEEKAAQMMKLAFAKGSHMFEWEHLRSNCEPFLVEVMLTTIKFHDRELLHAVWRDVTEHKRLETEQKRLQAQLQQAQKMEAIGQLTGGVAHDFNNILAAILGYTGLALDKFVTDKDSKLAEYLVEVYKAGERARDLIAKMLAFSRPQSGAQPKPMHAQTVVMDALKMLNPTLPASIRLIERVQVDSSPILMDAGDLQQIVTNLIINARDAIGDKGIIEVVLHDIHATDMECGTCHASIVGPYVELLVSDNGHGIEPNILHRVFDPFFTTKEVGKGTGMGLSIVHGLTHTHNGHLVVESGFDQGTRFRLLFPIAESVAELSSAVAAPIQPASDVSYGMVMIVDDEKMLAEMLGELLTANGYQVSVFTDSQQALDAFLSTPAAFDAVVTDQTMPNLAGDALAKKMLVVRPDLPIILCTGYSDHVDQTVADQLGIQRFFNKPVPSQDLLVALAELVLNKAA